ncbi:MAG: hypothetical protein ACM3JJ_00530 [Hyphomicrobiales bacterium]
MRPDRILTLTVLLALVAALAGCSQRVERIVGAERLLRGPGGLGTTMRAYGPLDRDTYVNADTAELGTTLIAGLTGTYEARTLLRVGTWVLPDTNDTSVSIDSVFFDLPFDGNLDVPSLNLQLWSATASFDSTNAAWPGPALGGLLGAADPSGLDQVYSYRVGLGNASNFGFFKAWAADSALVPAMVLRALNPGGIVGFRAGTGRIRIAYHHDVSGVSTPDTVNTPIAEDLFVHSPLNPTPTGSDPILRLGGLYETGLALHFPVGSFAEGFSINEARVVLRIDTGSMTLFGARDSVNVEIRRIGADWAEGVQAGRDLVADPVNLGLVANFRVATPNDSLLILPVPTSLVRDWSMTPANNHGILVRIEQSYRWPEIHVFSRESSRPPELWVSTTSPPPGRF